jgi:hypothetical protein
LLVVPGEILFCVVNDVVCANAPCRVQIARAANSGDFSTEHFGKLHRERTHTTGCAVD